LQNSRPRYVTNLQLENKLMPKNSAKHVRYEQKTIFRGNSVSEIRDST
jgi:hypothetical protein